MGVESSLSVTDVLAGLRESLEMPAQGETAMGAWPEAAFCKPKRKASGEISPANNLILDLSIAEKNNSVVKSSCL